MDAQNLLDLVQGTSRETSNGFVVYCKDSDGVAAIDLLVQLGFSQIVIQGAELWEVA